MRTHYDNLGVARNAHPEIIEAAYQTLKAKYSQVNDAESARILPIIEEAYRVLMDPEARRNHDLWIAGEEARFASVSNVTAVHATQPAASSGNNAMWILVAVIVIAAVLAAVALIYQISVKNNTANSSVTPYATEPKEQADPVELTEVAQEKSDAPQEESMPSQAKEDVTYEAPAEADVEYIAPANNSRQVGPAYNRREYNEPEYYEVESAPSYTPPPVESVDQRAVNNAKAQYLSAVHSINSVWDAIEPSTRDAIRDEQRSVNKAREAYCQQEAKQNFGDRSSQQVYRYNCEVEMLQERESYLRDNYL